MKQLLSIFFTLGLFGYLFAEYGGEYHQVEIHLESGEIDTGFFYVADAYFDRDSISHSAYLLERMARAYNYQSDSIRYYQYLLQYDFLSVSGDHPAKEYALIEPVILTRESIEKVRWLHSTRSSYLNEISSHHDIQDTIWMKRPPESSFHVPGVLCYWQVFVHQESEKIKIVQREIESTLQQLDHRLKELEQMVENYPSRENEDQLRDYEHYIDQRLDKMIQKLEGRLVVIGECTC